MGLPKNNTQAGSQLDKKNDKTPIKNSLCF